jgi:hypothetical protein
MLRIGVTGTLLKLTSSNEEDATRLVGHVFAWVVC